MTLHHFYMNVLILTHQTGHRRGQCLFNYLYEVRPELAESLRGTPADPFFSEVPSDPRYEAACQIIEKEWWK